MYSGFGFDSEHSSFRDSQLFEIDTDFVGINTLGIFEVFKLGFYNSSVNELYFREFWVI